MEKYHKIKELISKPNEGWNPILAIALAIILGQATALYCLRPWLGATQSPTTTEAIPKIAAVTALGRLEPKGGIIQLSASNSDQSNRVAQLLVRQGDRVHVGQVVALLDSHEHSLMNLDQAQAAVKVAQAHLKQIKAGAKPTEITAQQANVSGIKAQTQVEINTQEATVARLEPQLTNAQKEYNRYLGVYRKGVISASTLDSKRLAVETLKQQINEAKINLSRTKALLKEQTTEAQSALNDLQEVRPSDVREAQAEVDKAIVGVKQAQANLELSYVRSPINGQVLKIHTLPGEVISDKGQGIVELGQTDQMYVVAEVYESDIAKIHLGQRATLMSESNTVPEALHGTVDQIGLQIGKKDVVNNDPAADVDARVVDVKIRLDRADSVRVAGLTNMQMRVLINI